MARRWFTPRALLFHLCVLVLVPGCLFACWWQATRAASGNLLSWAYAVEWPVFAVIAVVGWWQLIHEDPAEVAARRRGTRTVPAGSPAVEAAEAVLREASRPASTAAPERTTSPASPTQSVWPAPSERALDSARAVASAAAYAEYLGGITNGRRPRGGGRRPSVGRGER